MNVEKIFEDTLLKFDVTLKEGWDAFWKEQHDIIRKDLQQQYEDEKKQNNIDKKEL